MIILSNIIIIIMFLLFTLSICEYVFIAAKLKKIYKNKTYAV